jgi:twitching motility protein PilT
MFVNSINQLTMHSHRILAMFPPEEQDVVRVRLAESLHAVISQRLLPRKDGNGRVAALEIMIVTPTIRDLMLDRDRVGEIRDFIAAGRAQYGMQTFDQHLEQLVQDDTIELQVALAAASRPSDLALKFSMNS